MSATNEGGEPRPQVRHLSRILAELGEKARPIVAAPPHHAGGHSRERSNITVDEIVTEARQAGFGFIIALLAIISLPFAGFSLPFGLALAFGGLQMMAGRARPWLPRRIREHRLTMRTIEWLSGPALRSTMVLERLARPRWIFLTQGPFWRLCGLGVVVLAVGLALPLPVPGTNLVFVVPIVVYAIGLLEADGLLVLCGHVLTAVHVVLAIVFYGVVKAALLGLWHWLTPVIG